MLPHLQDQCDWQPRCSLNRDSRKQVVLPPGAKKTSLPANLQQGAQAVHYANTTAVWVIGRVYVQGPSDLPGAQVAQAGMGAKLVNPASAQATHLTDAVTAAVKLLKVRGRGCCVQCAVRSPAVPDT
jgi:hypothetical protein